MIPIDATTDDPPSSSTEFSHFVLGDDHVSMAIAEQLHEDGHRVVIVNESYDQHHIPGITGDPSDITVLNDSGVAAASTVIVAASTDSRTLLIAQLVRAHFDVPRVITIVSDPDRLPLFESAGHEPFCATSALTTTLLDSV